MKALQHLREGKLIIGTASHEFLNDISVERESGAGSREPGRGGGAIGYLVAEATAKVLIRNKWVELKRFSPRKGIYRLSAKGEELTDLFCECRFRSVIGRQVALLNGIDPEATNEEFDWANQRLLCRRCWQRIACAVAEARASARAPSLTVGLLPHLHGANRLSGLGPICQKHFENPSRQ